MERRSRGFVEPSSNVAGGSTRDADVEEDGDLDYSSRNRPRLNVAPPSVFTGRWVDPETPAFVREGSFLALMGAGGQALGNLARTGTLNGTEVKREFDLFLAQFDRGDFRWEFLTPWRNEPLTSVDKLIIVSTFIGIALASQALWDPEASLFEHFSYIVFFFAYAIGNNDALRTLAILGSVFEILASLFDDAGPTRADVVPIGYESIFILINGYYALRAYLAHQPVDLAPVERTVYESCFEPFGLTESQFVKVLEFGEWHVAVGEELLCEQGLPVRDVFVPLAGEFSIIANGKHVGSIPALQLIGEVSLLENLQSPGGRYHRNAIASMRAEAGSTYVRFPQAAFYELMKADEGFAAAMQLMISKALSQKLVQLWEGRPSPQAPGSKNLGPPPVPPPPEAPPQDSGQLVDEARKSTAGAEAVASDGERPNGAEGLMSADELWESAQALRAELHSPQAQAQEQKQGQGQENGASVGSGPHGQRGERSA